MDNLVYFYASPHVPERQPNGKPSFTRVMQGNIPIAVVHPSNIGVFLIELNATLNDHNITAAAICIADAVYIPGQGLFPIPGNTLCWN